MTALNEVSANKAQQFSSSTFYSLQVPKKANAH